MLAALIIAVLAQSQPGYPPSRERISRFRFENEAGGTQYGSTPLPPFSVAFDYEWPYTGADRVPLCTDDATCVAVCGIGLRTGSATACECKGHDGLSVGTEGNPAATTYSSFLPGVKARWASALSADNCSVSSSTIDTAFASGAHASTTWTAAMPQSAAGGFNTWHFRAGGTSGLQTIRNNSGAYDVYQFSPTAWTTPMNGIFGINMSLAETRSSAASPAFALMASLADTGGRATVTHATDGVVDAVSGTGAWQWGNRATGDLGLNGLWVFSATYSEAKSQSQFDVLNAKLWGTYNVAGLITGGNGKGLGIDNTAATGQVDMAYQWATDAGLQTVRGFTNGWAADPLVLSGATSIGTPTINSNVSSGPFTNWKNAAECDEMVDDDAVNFEGKKSVASVTTGTDDAPAWYSQSAYFKAGLTGTSKTTAVQALVTDGTFSDGGTLFLCPITGLTSTATRYQCNALVTGSPTFVKGEILVGAVASDTGSVQVCQAQTSKSQVAQPPTTDNAAHGDTFFVSTSAASWPANGTSGKYELVHTPEFDPLTQWYTILDTYYAFDVSKGDNPDGGAELSHSVVIIFGYTQAGELNGVVRGPADEVSDLIVQGVGLTPGQAYATSVEWRVIGANPDGGSDVVCNTDMRHDACGSTPVASCVASTIIKSDHTGYAVCPGTPKKMTLGDRYDGSVPSNIHINAVRVYSL